MVATTNLSFYCSHFEWPEIWHALYHSELIRFFCQHVYISSLWRHFDLVKHVKFATSGHFLENTGEEWPEIWHAYVVCWPSAELIKFWSRSVDFPHFGVITRGQFCFDVVKQVKFSVAGHFLENAGEELVEICHADVSWPCSELIWFWSWSVKFPHFFSCLLCGSVPIWLAFGS